MIPHALSGLCFVERFYSYPRLSSTNDAARSIAHRPVKGMFCIQADRQTSGRGRRGSPFFSDSTGGLWVSLVVPFPDRENHFKYNRAISVAIVHTLDQCGKELPVSIKWPNDILWGNRKICGILLENHSRFEDILIIGFGLNVNIAKDEFPPELSAIATSLFIETGRRCSQSAMLRTILKHFAAAISADQDRIHSLYTSRLCGIGETIGINGIQGTFESVAADGRLRLLNGGIPVFVHSGSLVFLGKHDSLS